VLAKRLWAPWNHTKFKISKYPVRLGSIRVALVESYTPQISRAALFPSMMVRSPAVKLPKYTLGVEI